MNNDDTVPSASGIEVPKKQPTLYDGSLRERKRFIASAANSVDRLKTLGFDPIEKLVRTYEILERQHEWMLVLQNGSAQQLGADGKKVKTHRYSSVAHSKVLEQMVSVCEKLLRYMYGRVPETININADNKKSMTIMLTKKNHEGTFQPITINGIAEEGREEEGLD